MSRLISSSHTNGHTRKKSGHSSSNPSSPHNGLASSASSSASSSSRSHSRVPPEVELALETMGLFDLAWGRARYGDEEISHARLLEQSQLELRTMAELEESELKLSKKKRAGSSLKSRRKMTTIPTSNSANAVTRLTKRGSSRLDRRGSTDTVAEVPLEPSPSEPGDEWEDLLVNEWDQMTSFKFGPEAAAWNFTEFATIQRDQAAVAKFATYNNDQYLYTSQPSRATSPIGSSSSLLSLESKGGSSGDLIKDSDAIPAPDQYRSFNEMIVSLTSPAFIYTNSKDTLNEEIFVMMIPTITNHVTIILKLIQRYYVDLPPSIPSSGELFDSFESFHVSPIRKRVVQLLKMHVKASWPEFTVEERTLVRGFAKVLDPAFAVFISSQIRSSILDLSTRNAKITSLYRSLSIPFELGAKEKKPDVFELSTDVLAKYLAHIEHSFFQNVRPEEFQRQVWMKRPTRAPHVRAMIDRFNVITRWIASLIVTADKIKIRVRRFVKLVQLAEELLALGDYHTMMAVISGLGEGAVHRLKFTQEELPEKTQEGFKRLQNLMHATKSYTLYRESLSQANFAVPYIGVHLRDLVYFDDSVRSLDGKFNTKALVGIYQIIAQFEKFQTFPYVFDLTQPRLLHYLLTLPDVMSSADLLKSSQAIEPRDAKRENIQ